MSARTAFRSTSREGLNYDLPPMRLWQKAKRLGVWNPEDIDFSQDARDWESLSSDERDLLLLFTSQFQAGEEAVTVDLLPLIMTVAEEGRIEEEIYLTSFLWEEAKHLDAFETFRRKVVRDRHELGHYHGPAYRRIFHEELPSALNALRTDRSPEAQARASVTYNLIVEGVLAETGYHSYHKMLVERGLMPGMQTLVAYLKQDESRHLAYGVFLLSRLVAEHGDPVWNVIETRMQELLEPAVQLVSEAYERYSEIPFGIDPREMEQFAQTQFEHRMTRIAKAREQSLQDIYNTPDEAFATA
jgi:ribonucleoside-diphosphate reductase beta chain